MELVKADQTSAAAETVLFYKLNFITDYDRILTSCNALWEGEISVSSTLTVEDAYARYKKNDDNYKTLINNLDNVIVAKYNAVKSEVDAFKFYEPVFKEWDGMIEVKENWTTAEERKLDNAVEKYRQDIEAAAADINLKYGANAMLGIADANDAKFTDPASTLTSDIATFETGAKYREASYTYLFNISETLSDVYSELYSNNNKYTQSTKLQLKNEYKTLDEARNYANQYNSSVFNFNGTYIDIDGNYIELSKPSDPTVKPEPQ